ncbi:hypothetical protein Tco_0703042 [Tanacetum coccineum]|uniref:Uncharacterized protein n=1 Tax=Tanacetum coccineum TaxID=301880 RepID=A0ABQ4XZ93_9ASTR
MSLLPSPPRQPWGAGGFKYGIEECIVLFIHQEKGALVLWLSTTRARMVVGLDPRVLQIVLQHQWNTHDGNIFFYYCPGVLGGNTYDGYTLTVP